VAAVRHLLVWEGAYLDGPMPPEGEAAVSALGAVRRAEGGGEGAATREGQAQCDLLRDIIGNPFRPPPALHPAWLSSNDGAVRKLAEAIYGDRRFGDLPVLADALEDAGCIDPTLLAHCRGGDHVRGCWVLDLLLGRG
jgi:hypothetical protein